MEKGKTIEEVLRKLSCIQVDPIKVIARSHEISLWNRVENFVTFDLDESTHTNNKSSPYHSRTKTPYSMSRVVLSIL